MLHAKNMGDGTLKLRTSRSDPRVQALVKRLNFWLSDQLTDWREVLEQPLRYRFGYLLPDGDSRDGLQFSMVREYKLDGGEMNLVRESSPGERFQQGVIDNIEAVSQYQPAVARGRYGDLGLFRRLGVDPTWSEGKDNVTEGLLSGYWMVETSTAAQGDSRAEELRRCIESDLEPLLNEQLIREFVEACFDDGFGVWEIVDGFDGSIRELAPINANTVEQWITDPWERELLRVGFNTGRRRYEVDARHLMVYSHRRTGANFEGRAQMRSAAGWIEMKHAFTRLMGFAGEVHGLGIKTIEQTNPELAGNSTEGAKVVEIFSELTAEDNPVIELPGGRTFHWHSPANGIPQFVPILDHLDQQISRPASASGTLLGFQQFGNRSLGEVADVNALRTVVYYGILLSLMLRRDVIPRIARNKYGWNGVTPLPKLRYVTQREVKDPERHKRLAVYVGSNMITWTREDENRLRLEEGMPPLPDDHPRGDAMGDTDPTATLREAGAQPHNDLQATTDPVPDDLISMRQAAERMGVSTRTIANMCRRGKLRFWKLGSHWQVSLHDVVELAAQAATEAVAS